MFAELEVLQSLHTHTHSYTHADAQRSRTYTRRPLNCARAFLYSRQITSPLSLPSFRALTFPYTARHTHTHTPASSFCSSLVSLPPSLLDWQNPFQSVCTQSKPTRASPSRCYTHPFRQPAQPHPHAFTLFCVLLLPRFVLSLSSPSGQSEPAPLLAFHLPSPPFISSVV